MTFVGHAQGRKSPSIFCLGVQGDCVRFKWQTCSMRENSHSTIEIFLQCFLKSCSPAGRVRRQARKRESDGVKPTAGIDSTAAIEAALRIRVIEIMDDAGHAHALEVIQRVLESPQTQAAEVHHEELADHSVGI